MVEFIATGRSSYLMREEGREVVAVHQVLTIDVWRGLDQVIAEMRPGNVFEARQYPAANTYLYATEDLDTGSLFPYPHTLEGDKLSLVIREILSGRSRVEPITTQLPIAYCVAAGIIDEVHVQTSRHRYYEDILGTEHVVFHDPDLLIPYPPQPAVPRARSMV